MTEEVKPTPVRKPRTKKAAPAPAAPLESPKELPPKAKAVDSVLDSAPVGIDMAKFKGSYRTKSGSVITYL